MSGTPTSDWAIDLAADESTPAVGAPTAWQWHGSSTWRSRRDRMLTGRVTVDRMQEDGPRQFRFSYVPARCGDGVRWRIEAGARLLWLENDRGVVAQTTDGEILATDPAQSPLLPCAPPDLVCLTDVGLAAGRLGSPSRPELTDRVVSSGRSTLRFQTPSPEGCTLDVDEETGFVLALDGADKLGPVHLQVHDFRIEPFNPRLFEHARQH